MFQEHPSLLPTAGDLVLTADVVVIQRDHVLLVQRRSEPFAGMWALPGGKQRDPNECFERTAVRELREETGLSTEPYALSFLDVFSTPGRDPRGPFVSFAYLLCLSSDQSHLQAGSDAQAVGWFPVNRVPPLAFDHREILDVAFKRLFGRMLLTGHLVHAAFRSVEALTPQLGPWEDLPDMVQSYYLGVARYLSQRLHVCQGCGQQQHHVESLERRDDLLLCQACRLPSPRSWEQAQQEGGAQ